MSAHGPSCGNTDEAALLKINNICNEYGICGDTSGITLAAALSGISEDHHRQGYGWNPSGVGNIDSHIQMLMRS